MKSSRLLPLAATFSLVSCAQIASTLQEPITSDYNPLDGPNAPSMRNKSFQQTGPTYEPGEWVETAMPNSTFFYKIPKGNATADKVMGRGTPLKVISTKGSYLKVELEGGTVGYVPAIMVAEPSSSTDDTPFLPPPPSAPLQRSNDDFAPPSVPATAPAGELNDGGSSLIPAPASYDDGTSSTPSAPTPERKPTEVLIPTTNTAPAPVEVPSAPSGASSIPAPSGAGSIDQTIGIE